MANILRVKLTEEQITRLLALLHSVSDYGKTLFSARELNTATALQGYFRNALDGEVDYAEYDVE